MDEFAKRSNSHSTVHIRERSAQLLYAGPVHHLSERKSAVVDTEEPSLQFKWSYVVRLLLWQHAGGLLVPSLVIDWVLRQLQV